MVFSLAMREHAQSHARDAFGASQRENGRRERRAKRVAMGLSRGKTAFAVRSKSNISQ
jgi:hypothetical protein